MSAVYETRISRRTTLQWFAAVVAVARTAKGAHAQAAPARGFGLDPNLFDPTAPWPRTMTREQLQAAAVLADLILPPTKDAPAPSAIGVPDFVDEWISAPYPDQQADRAVILAGLAWLDTESQKRWRRRFVATTASARQTLLKAMAPTGKVAPSNGFAAFERDAGAVPLEHDFLRRFRYVTIGAYYTTPEGFRDIGYIGNVALESYPPVSDSEKAILAEELRKLGIAS